MRDWRTIASPIDDETVESLISGDRILLTGVIYAARDRAHKRLCEMAGRNEKLPFDPAGQIIYYMGPSPAPAGKIIGSAGPTTTYRMDPFTETMLKLGVRGMIGKGTRGRDIRELMAWYRAVYFATFGGAGAYLAARIKESEIVAFPDLGPEAVLRLRVEDFPVIVINDIHGGDLYEDVVRR
ncbi:MAG: fumarate hydratase C-terminal domain-containing protein [Spirochaetes bacterium]|nr:fumarate hydratase C-terminal domain-containing protein [Spirochaetota bacterium]